MENSDRRTPDKESVRKTLDDLMFPWQKSEPREWRNSIARATPYAMLLLTSQVSEALLLPSFPIC